MSDLIRRQDALQAIIGITTCENAEGIEIHCDASVADSEGWLGGVRDALRAIEDIPSAEPERRWIPISEALLPKDMDRLLATIVRSDGSKRVRSGHYYKGLFMMDNGDTWKETDKEILAWMPLVEPWRGE